MKCSIRRIVPFFLIFLLVISSTAGQYAFAKFINNGVMADCPMMMDMGSDHNKKMSGDCYHKGCPCDISLCSSAFYIPSNTFDRAMYPIVSVYISIANQNGDNLYVDIPTAPPKYIS